MPSATLSAFDEDSDPGRKSITHLPFEILKNIITHIDHGADDMVNMDRRGYLSQESFRTPERPSDDEKRDIGNFRLVCRLFSGVGAEHQFIRVTTRFGVDDFKRLRGIASNPRIARIVRKFSYMVPIGFYYHKGEQAPLDPPQIPGVELSRWKAKKRLHRDIVESDIDQETLRFAFKAFTNLQQVQLLRSQNQDDKEYREVMLPRYPQLRQWARLDWVYACVYGTKSITEAIMLSGNPCTRFSSPHISSDSALILAQNPPGQALGMIDSLDSLASRLTCLELHFDLSVEFWTQARLQNLPFGAMFTHARNLEAIHVGFQPYLPVELGLEDVFHSIRWEKLVAFGIQGWELSSEEIIALADRHKDKLRGLRLRNVYLKENSRWKDVLHYLRNNMRHLEWVSLRRIGYISQLANPGIEITDDVAVDSDDDDEFLFGEDDDPFSGDDEEDDFGEGDSGFLSEDLDTPDDDDQHSESGTDVVAAHTMAFPASLRASRPARCNCNADKLISVEKAEDELGDELDFITDATRRIWERWVVNKCPLHGPHAVVGAEGLH